MALLCFLISACPKSHGPIVDKNTNWLKSCNEDTSCGEGSSCLCGICTHTCETDSDCDQLPVDPICVPTDRFDNAHQCLKADPIVEMVCDIPCKQDKDCSPLGERFTCPADFCRDETFIVLPADEVDSSMAISPNDGGVLKDAWDATNSLESTTASNTGFDVQEVETCDRKYRPDIICEQEETSCTFFVQLGSSTCKDYCEAHGGECLAAKSNDGEGCKDAGPRDCDDSVENQICTCSI